MYTETITHRKQEKHLQWYYNVPYAYCICWLGAEVWVLVLVWRLWNRTITTPTAPSAKWKQHTHTHIYTDIQKAIASTKDTAMTCHYIYSATAHLYVISHFHLLFRTHLLLAFCLSHIFFECICSCVHCTVQHFHQHLILFPCSFVSREWKKHNQNTITATTPNDQYNTNRKERKEKYPRQ